MSTEEQGLPSFHMVWSAIHDWEREVHNRVSLTNEIDNQLRRMLIQYAEKRMREMWLIKIDADGHSFNAIGRTKIEATRSVRGALVKHGAEKGYPSDWCLGFDAQYLQMDIGKGYRDFRPITDEGQS